MLLLLRASKRNPGRWALPGGNVKAKDADLLATAKREAAEELGGRKALPPYELAGTTGFLTK
jgi:8-oxo-dGTP pyrophosphatase MutT (NUDIX family)